MHEVIGHGEAQVQQGTVLEKENPGREYMIGRDQLRM